ncbi:hypothetical protein Goe25_01310 [Bacillus phage vB_BsuM-Goe25]|uniref:Uncharacterized protein n=1 Tax=Bacillus phage vB_BsuM-Goe3 TaxID=1933063 RepID=A0A217ER71_BPGO3|nr:hypothetical protein HWB07_gp182 [Bacillus phage vB_BsuM-Goe3]APZ82588.1 hypothetical protein Goe3_c12700 [Bacillus phage vB_BsuM-Goe3]WCS69246.1 hypothetical protein Goe20_01290 [Bacillus phage vB_BsuM-Goe20]WCS69759.1 hypothetical protein Goe25_01310 [Bacillus phage vB_BsuM-Goe25]
MLDVLIDSLDFYVLRLRDENGEFIEYDLRKELSVNEDNFLEEMIEQPSKYIYWSSVLERLRMFQESVELKLEVTIAKLDEQARESITAKGQKPTKDMVESFIKRQPEYQKAKENEIYYNHVVGRIQRIVKSFEQRKDMLQSYGKQVLDNKQYGWGAGTKAVNPQIPEY